MAARLNPRHSDLVLKRIKTSQLVNRLQDNALGVLKYTTGPDKGKPYQLSRSQVACATFLIERTLAKAEKPIEVDHSGQVAVSVSFIDPPKPNRDKPGH